MKEITVTTHAKGWAKAVLKVGGIIWSGLLIVLGIIWIAHLYARNEPVLATLLLGTVVTLLVGSLAYAIEHAEMRRRERQGHYR